MKDTLTPFLERFKKNLEEQAKDAVQISVDHARDLAKKNHNYKDQSKSLTDATISKPVKQNGSILVGEIANSSELSLYFHEGTGLFGLFARAYYIKPIDPNGWLIFEIRGKKGKRGLKGKAGKLVKVKQVLHPGIKPDPFIWRAIHDTRPYFLKKLQGAFKKAIRMSVKK